MTEAKQVQAGQPWLMKSAIDWLDSVVTGDSVVLETGSGNSTVWLARRVFRLVTYEHDEIWARRAQAALQMNCSAELIDFRFRPNYPTAGLAELPWLDLALIDGRGRVRSVIDALPRVKPGGWLILDDAGRERYAEARRIMDDACSERIEFRCPPWTPEYWTTAWRKR